MPLVWKERISIKKIKRHSLELEEKVRRRTAELERAHEDQRQMVMDVSHGLQTPLTVARGEIDLLQKQIPANKKLELAAKSIDSVSRVIYDLLNLTYLEASQENFKKDRVNLSVLMDEMVEYFETLAVDQNIELASRVEPGIIFRCHKEKIEELIRSLVSNAFKYLSSNGERRITIELRRNNRFTELLVKDTGIGISSEDLPRIFDRFYRVKNGATANTPGIGLGLAICRKIAERHSGTISVESEIGKGAAFLVRFQ